VGERQESEGGAPSRRSFCYALSCWTLSVSAVVISVTYSSLNQLPKSASSFQSGPANGPVAVVFVGAFATVGALLAWKRPANAIGWLLSAAALSFSCGGISLLFAYEPGALTLAKWLGWIWLFGLGLVVPVLLIFPTGRLLSRRWRPVGWATSAGLAAWVLGNTFAPTIITADVRTANPIGISGGAGKAFQLLAIAGAVILLGCGLAAIASLVSRYRRAQLIEREQLKWLVFASAIIVVALVIEVAMQNVLGSTETSTDLQNAISSGAAALVPVAIGVAVFRYRLYDIDVVISKTLVYGSLAAFITGVYVAIVVGLGSLLTDHRGHPGLLLPIIATAIVAIAFQPVRERAQHLANRLVYGKRATPYEVLADLAAQTAGTYATEQVLPQMARILAAGTAAARADVWLVNGGELRNDATWPRDAPLLPPISATQASGLLACPGTDRILPVRHQGELLGALSVTKRPGESLTPTEGRLLEDLAAHVGLVLRNVGLWEELTARLEDIRASRRRLVAAQDAERRRVERNIHDGAQQQLVALAIKLSLVESMIGVDPAGEREMLSELRADATAASRELWDLAQGIYPPLLVAEGLASALSAQAARSPIPTELHAEGIGRYPQEVEAAAYFCVLEALQNVAKYSGATTTRILVSAASGDLEFEVADDGVGFDATARAYGSGLQGIADRLGAHRGQLEVHSTPGAGTVIRGRLPRSALEPAA
jgi:signal transduction histidine kinase